MRIPRWTTYPAFAVLLIVAITALPHAVREKGEASRARARAIRESGGSSTSRSEPRGQVQELRDFLPPGHVTDGSVDYREEVQQAIDATQSGTLLLPDFPIQVGGARYEHYCLVIRRGMTLAGSPASVLLTRDPAVQVLRAQGVQGLVLKGFAVRGVGTGGADLGHGLIQVTGGANVQLEGLTVSGADSDGIAVAGVNTCTVEGCLVEGASKSGIYLSSCSNVVVRGNIVRSFGGHQSAGHPVGAGIQLSSNEDLVCSDNVISDGRGVGILCNAFQGGPRPWGNVIRGNRIRSVSNSTNAGVSCGIRCANGNAEKDTGTLVSDNSLYGCGAHGIYLENHGASAVTGNLIVESEGSGILISTIQDLQVLDNVILFGAGGVGPSLAIRSINSPVGVTLEGNVVRESGLLGGGQSTAER